MFKKLFSLYVFVLLLVAVPLVTHGQAQNLLQNPSFEQDEAILDDPDWSQWCTWNPAEGAGSNVTIVDTDSVDGNRCLMIEPKGTAAGHFFVIYTPVALEVGTNYTTTFWAKAAVPRPLGVTVKAADNSVSWTSTTFDLTTEWAEYSLSGVAENATAKIDFACAATNDTIWLDNVSMFEPSLVTNGSFEEDEAILDDPDWSQWCTWNPAEGAGSNATIVDTDFYDGARSLMIEPKGTAPGHFYVIYQPVALEVGREYVTTFWAKAAVPRPLGVTMKAADNSVSWVSQDFQLTTEWTEYSLSGVAENGTAKIDFACAATNDTIWLDFVSVVEVEVAEPGPLVANGSFEEDEAILDDPDWVQWCTWNPAQGAGSNVTIVDTEALDGARSLMIEPKGTDGWHFILLYSGIPLEVGTNYVATFWAKAAAPRPLHVETKATDNSVTWGRADFNLTTDWVEYSASSVAENASAKLEFHCAATNDPIWLDLVSVEEEALLAPSILLNGSFEEDEVIQEDPDWLVWTTWGWEAGLEGRVIFDQNDAIHGDWSLRIEPRGGTNWFFMVLQDYIPLDVGRDYTITFWAKAAAPRPLGVQLKATDNSITWSGATFDLTTEWAEYTVSGAALNASAKLEFHCAATDDTIWLDNVTLRGEALPPPLLINGSFEEDEPILDDDTWEAWCTWYPSGVTGNNVMIVDTEAIDGARSLQVDPKGTLIVANINFPLNIGSNATATFWAKAQSPRPLSANFKADDNSVSWGNTDFQLTTEWAEYSMTSAAGSDLGKLEFSCGASEVRFWLDNVSIVVEEEPAPLVTNGSFESDFAGWWTWNPEGGGGSWTVIDTESVDGDKSLRVDSLGTENWHYMVINSPILLDVGTTYTASIWARAEEPRSISVKLKAIDNSTEWGNTDFQLTTEWDEYYFTAEATNGAVKFEIHVGTSIPVWLDFVNVYEGQYDPGIAPTGTPNAAGPNPANGAIDVSRDVTLSWKPGNAAVTHDVYFGTNFDDVDSADVTDATGIYRTNLDLATTSFTPAESPLEWDQTYYWRIDAVNDTDPNSPWKGNVWSFTTANFVVVDDFESYNDIPTGEDGSNLVYVVWADGFDDPTKNGSTIGYPTGASMETDDVYSGNQSVPVMYDNSTAGISEVTRMLNADWTQNEVLTLTLFYKGRLSNDAEPMYIALNGIAIYHYNPNAVKVSSWIQWDILLQDFADLGVNVAGINTLTIGFGNKAAPAAGGGSGSVLIDDIRLYRSLPIEQEPLPEPIDPGTANLVVSYSFEDNVRDGSGNGLDGTPWGNPFFVDGFVGKALSFDGINDYVEVGNNAAFDITEQITISAWVNTNDSGDGLFHPYVGKGDHAYALKHASNNSIEFVIYDGGWFVAQVSVDESFNGEWHHVLGTYDGSEVKTYVDGILGATTAHQGSIEVQTHNLAIAINSEERDRLYNGMIDEVKIYNRALSAGEIRFLVGN
ncbi:MAG: carbohydrate binding domain-containing protein [Phycisphaerales bacterium]|nr:MAG: carbohydrate binding domain-containing protein [Phycisphaerales bacterium]